VIRSRVVRLLISVLVVSVLAAVTHTLWMPPLGRALVHSDAPVRADAALVLAGDFYGKRILRAAGLVREGYAPKVLVSGPAGMFGYYECDLAIDFAVKQGYSRDLFVRLPNTALSTTEEAAALLPGIRRMGIRRLLVVTSDYHTARSLRVYRAAAPDLEIRTVAAPDEHFRPDAWWRSRQSRKIFLMEWSKTVAHWAGM